MCHKLLGDVRLFETLVQIDEELAADARAAGCPYCAGRLDSARYPRKPRGGPSALDAVPASRRSFCCAAPDCRRRTTPASVCFLGRRVYLAAVIVLLTAFEHGATVRRVEELRVRLGVSLTTATVSRWRTWWRERFPRAPFWKHAKGRFTPPVAESLLPGSLLVRFATGDEAARVAALLRFVAPITAPVSSFAM